MTGRLQEAERRLRPIVSCAAAFNTIMAALFLLLAMLSVALGAFGISIPNLLEALR